MHLRVNLNLSNSDVSTRSQAGEWFQLVVKSENESFKAHFSSFCFKKIGNCFINVYESMWILRFVREEKKVSI